MKRKIASIPAIALVIMFSIFSLNAISQTTLPDGRPNPGGGIYAPVPTDDFIFGWSGYSANNVLVLNGTPVVAFWSG